jgi:hypothetical protein
MDSKLALKVNKFIHEQCIDGTPHDIGWNVIKLIESETQVKLFCQPHVMRSVCCGEELVSFKTYGYDECCGCGKTYLHTDT